MVIKKTFLKKVSKYIDIIFWTIIIISAIFTLINDDIIKDIVIIGDTNIISMCFSLFLFFLFFIGIAIFKNFNLTLAYILYKIIRIAYKKFYKEKLNIDDFKNDSYYREIMQEYSPGQLSFIDDFNIDEKDIVATVLSLELKGKIKIEDKIIILNNEVNDLKENEKYVFEKIKKGENIDAIIVNYGEKVINDCIKDKLIETKTDTTKKIKKKIFIAIFIYILIILENIYGFNIIQINNELINFALFIFDIVLFLGIFFFPIAAIIYITSYYTMTKINPYVRNKRAKDINYNLEGLRNFIKDYSLLEQKDYKDIVIWENYLIYSVFLGNNNRIVKQIIEKLNNN